VYSGESGYPVEDSGLRTAEQKVGEVLADGYIPGVIIGLTEGLVSIKILVVPAPRITEGRIRL
jgi:hypothetical protein